MLVVLIGAVSAAEDGNVIGNGTSDVQDIEPLAIDNNQSGDVDAPAVDVNETGDDDALATDGNDTSEDDIIQNKTAKFEVSKDTNYLNKSTFSVKLVDENGTGIANKSVSFKLNGVTSYSTTDGNGVAKLKLAVPKVGTWTVTYSFSEEGYTSVKSSMKLFILTKGVSKFKASNYVAYYGVTNSMWSHCQQTARLWPTARSP
jgi:hypothetical protein